MIHRAYWIDLVEKAWRHRSVIWLSGVRRSGKTCLCKTLPDVEYFDCELPRTRRMMEAPQDFLNGMGKRRVILDEIHRLQNPSELLKIASDHYPGIRILATGSSTLGASSKFKDTLTGRKRDIWLTPMMSVDMEDFKNTGLKHRFLRGGLPPFFMAGKFPERDFQEWMDAFWAKDIQVLFRLERRDSFQKFMELLMAQSGGIFEATKFSRPCEVSRTTIKNYLNVLEAMFVVHIVRPFTTHRPTEIVAAPRVYGFDTGFICYHRGWHSLRQEDFGVLWEHYVLNEIQARSQSRRIQYWRDKAGHEVDFILVERGSKPLAIECKWSASNFDSAGLNAFRRQYPGGESFVVARDVNRSFVRTHGKVKVKFTSLDSLLKNLAARPTGENPGNKRLRCTLTL